jgi:parallel beta-helix repeat protein
MCSVTRRLPRYVFAFLFIICLVGCGGNGETGDITPPPDAKDSGCSSSIFPVVPGDGPVIYVAQCEGDGVGTKTDPFTSLAAAVLAAPDGAAIAVAEGTYDAAVVVSKSLTIRGVGPEETLLVASGESAAIYVSQAEAVTLEGFGIIGDSVFGLAISNSQDVAVHNVAVSGVGGDGAGAGLIVKLSNKVVIGKPQVGTDIDGAVGCLVKDTTSLGIHIDRSDVHIEGNRIEGAKLGGIGVIDSGGNGDIVTIRANEIVGNSGYGVAVFGGEVMVDGNQISTVAGDDDDEDAHCISVSGTEVGPAIVQVLGNSIQGCSGAGVLLDGVASSNVDDNTIEQSTLGGIVLQLDADASVSGNTIIEPGVAGLSLWSGSSAQIIGNSISLVSTVGIFDYATQETVPHAFGILVDGDHPKGKIYLAGNLVTSCEMAGILIHDNGPEEVLFGEGNHVAGNADCGIALESGAEAIAEAQDLESLISFSSPDDGLEGNGPTGSENVVIDTSYIPVS